MLENTSQSKEQFSRPEKSTVIQTKYQEYNTILANFDNFLANDVKNLLFNGLDLAIQKLRKDNELYNALIQFKSQIYPEILIIKNKYSEKDNKLQLLINDENTSYEDRQKYQKEAQSLEVYAYFTLDKLKEYLDSVNAICRKFQREEIFSNIQDMKRKNIAYNELREFLESIRFDYEKMIIHNNDYLIKLQEKNNLATEIINQINEYLLLLKKYYTCKNEYLLLNNRTISQMSNIQDKDELEKIYQDFLKQSNTNNIDAYKNTMNAQFAKLEDLLTNLNLKEIKDKIIEFKYDVHYTFRECENNFGTNFSVNYIYKSKIEKIEKIIKHTLRVQNLKSNQIILESQDLISFTINNIVYSKLFNPNNKQYIYYQVNKTTSKYISYGQFDKALYKAKLLINQDLTKVEQYPDCPLNSDDVNIHLISDFNNEKYDLLLFRIFFNAFSKDEDFFLSDPLRLSNNDHTINFISENLYFEYIKKKSLFKPQNYSIGDFSYNSFKSKYIKLFLSNDKYAYFDLNVLESIARYFNYRNKKKYNLSIVDQLITNGSIIFNDDLILIKQKNINKAIVMAGLERESLEKELKKN